MRTIRAPRPAACIPSPSTDRLKETDAIFSVGLGPRIDRPVLQQLADVSGGEAYFPQDVSVLGADFNRVLETSAAAM